MKDDYISKDRLRQIIFLFSLVFLGFLLAKQLSSFLPALLGAITLYILTRNSMERLVKKKKWSVGLAAWTFMLLSLLLIMLPIAGLVSMLSSKVAFAINNSNQFIESLKTVMLDMETRFGVDILNEETINKLGRFITQAIPKLIGVTFSTLGTLFFMYFILYFMLTAGKDMEYNLYEYIPLKDENVSMLRREIENVVVSNAIGIPVIALLQGLVGVIGYYIIGVQDPWFWFVVTCITAMIPVVGAAVAYVPLAIIFFANNQVTQGIFMLIFGFGVIGTVDNVFRFTIAKKIGNVHPLVTIFGVIVGLQLFGFIGLIFGPLLISLFILLLKIYSSEFFVKHREIERTESDLP